MSFSLANPVILTLAIIAFVALCLATVVVYWQVWKIMSRGEITDLDKEQILVEKLGGDSMVPIPAIRQTREKGLSICVLLAAWPFLYAGYIFLGGLGFTLIGILFGLVWWYAWERTVGFCNRVAAARRRLKERS